VIVADTGAIVALVDADDRHHAAPRRLFETSPDDWILPWAILPEVDYLLAEHVSARARERFSGDLASGAWAIEWGDPADLVPRGGDLAAPPRPAPGARRLGGDGGGRAPPGRRDLDPHPLEYGRMLKRGLEWAAAHPAERSPSRSPVRLFAFAPVARWELSSRTQAAGRRR
jgi:hypothetical protein